MSLKRINAFNNETLFARAFRDEDEYLTIKGSLSLRENELTDAIFSRHFHIFESDIELALGKLF